MQQTIPFAEGNYLVERAFLVTPAKRAASLHDATIEVFKDPKGQRQMQGKAFVRNISIVELMEDEDQLDLFLDLGAGFKYLLRDPWISAGKVFSPNVRSILRFSPRVPIEELSEEGFLEQLQEFETLPE